MLAMTLAEQALLKSYLNVNQTVLEYGSGESTIEICKLVKNLISVEHNIEWYNKVKDKIQSNVTYLFEKPNSSFSEGGDDGNYEQFKSYIECPEKYGPYDIVIIDGRARYECAKFINEKCSHDNTIIFIHDFILPVQGIGRETYTKVLDFLQIINKVDMLYMFKRK